MAKFGEKKQEYDPFNSISSSLSALSEPVVEDAVASPAPAEQVAEPKPAPAKKPVRATKKVEQPARATGQAPKQPAVEVSSGGAASPVADDAGQSVALRVTKRIKINKQEAARLEMAALRLSATVGIGVDLSKITRALWEIYLTHEDEILRSLPDDAVPAKRPANHDAIGLAELDERLASMIGEGLMMASMRSRRNG